LWPARDASFLGGSENIFYFKNKSSVWHRTELQMSVIQIFQQIALGGVRMQRDSR
jgi:hypothetical protein